MSTLGKWLSSLGFPHELTSELKDFGIVTSQDLTLLSEKSLTDVIGSLNLKRKDQIKFELAVRRCEIDTGQRLVLTPKEDQSIKQLISRTQTAQGFLKEIQTALTSVEKHAKDASTKVNKTFQDVDNSLKARKKLLLKRILQEKEKKSKSLERQAMQVSATIAKYSKARSDSERLLKITTLEGLSDRESKLQERVAETSNLKIEAKLASLPEMFITFDGLDSIQKTISGLGELVSGAFCPPPTIVKVTPSDKAVMVEWNPPKNWIREPGAQFEVPKASQYALQVMEVEQKCAEGQSQPPLEKLFNINKSEARISNLERRTTYSVKMRTKNGSGWGKFGDITQFKTTNKKLVKSPMTPISCSSEHAAANAKEKVTSPQTENYWLSSSGVVTDQWIVFDLQSVRVVGQFKIQGYATGNIGPKNIVVEASESPSSSSWNCVSEVVTSNTGKDLQSFDIDVETRYIRLFFRDRHGSSDPYILVTYVEFYHYE